MSQCIGDGCDHSSHGAVPALGDELLHAQAVSERLGLVEAPSTPKREIIDMRVEGWQERASRQVDAFGSAVLEDELGLLLYDPRASVPRGIEAHAKRNCKACLGRGFIRRAHGKLHDGRMVWQERICGCTKPRSRR